MPISFGFFERGDKTVARNTARTKRQDAAKTQDAGRRAASWKAGRGKRSPGVTRTPFGGKS